MSKLTNHVELGFFPLQDHASGLDMTPASARQMVAGMRVSDIKGTETIGDPPDSYVATYGSVDSLGTLGDVHPWMFWQVRDPVTRGCGSYAQVFGAVSGAAKAEV